MALFTTLALQSKQNDGVQSTPKSLELPTVVQLFTDHPIPLSTDTALYHAHQQLQLPTTSSSSSSMSSSSSSIYYSSPPSYAVLHYTAVQCQNAAQMELLERQQRGLRQLAKKTVTVATPDLGVWNFRVSNRSSSATASSSSTRNNNKSDTSSTSTTTTSTPTIDSLLASIATKSSESSLRAFCMVVDLSILENVEPSITKMQEALVRYLINLEPTEHHNGGGTKPTDSMESLSIIQTTTLFQLKMVQFGLGPEDKKSTEAMSKTEPDPSDHNKSIALQICVKLPANELDFQEYKDQQAIALIVYHLRRYTAALSASLLFVSGAGVGGAGIGIGNNALQGGKDGIPTTDLALSPSKSKDSMESTAFVLLQEQPTVPVHFLPLVWREWALGKQVWVPEACPELYKDLNIDVAIITNNNNNKDTQNTSVNDSEEVEASGTDNEAVVSAYSLIYGPGAQNEELIESVLLRNAHYPGHWDAAKDSVWTILPKESPSSSSTTTTTTTANKKYNTGTTSMKEGDDWWLSELRESIAIPDSMKTPPPKKATDSAASATKTPNDSAVSSFFEDLLK